MVRLGGLTAKHRSRRLFRSAPRRHKLPRREHPDETAGGATYLGDYESIDAYLRAMLEPEIHPGIAGILDCLDMSRVRARFESDGSRLKLADGKVFKIG